MTHYPLRAYVTGNRAPKRNARPHLLLISKAALAQPVHERQRAVLTAFTRNNIDRDAAVCAASAVMEADAAWMARYDPSMHAYTHAWGSARSLYGER